LITSEHRDRVRTYVEGAADEGATVVVDGSGAGSGNGERNGFFIGCSLIDDVKPGMRVYDDEIFGPVLGVVRVSSLDEALTLVNQNPYGNGTAVFTRDGGAARRFEREVQAGMVGVNVPIPVPVASHSFGGWKDSIFGNSSIYGPDGVRFYTRPKVVTSRWPDPGPGAGDVQLHFPTNR
jgi:malonate-semialdehyde dehydrogenase (acetylating)/methylmalonate-semialdehyde dehydrogenase